VTQQVELRARGAARTLLGRASSIALTAAGLWLATQAPAQATTDFSATASYVFGGGMRSGDQTQVINDGLTLGGSLASFVQREGSFRVGKASVLDDVKMSIVFGHMGIQVSGQGAVVGSGRISTISSMP